MKGKLFDAGASINVMIRKGGGALKLLKGQHMLDLTIYEVGNALWRLASLEKKISNEQACMLLESFMLMMQNLQVLNINGMERSVKELSAENRITFYDASYLIAAERNDLVLVTDDKVLERAASRKVEVLHSDDL
jgi:predicted nucleic acid-binding protein